MAESINSELDAEQEFMRAVGDAIADFVEKKGYKQVDVAKKLNASKQALNAYFRNRKDGTRPRLPLYTFYLICTQLRGFHFDYEGYRISAKQLKQDSKRESVDQLTLQFDRSFSLTEDGGTLRIKVKRPPERLELLVTVDAKAS